MTLYDKRRQEMAVNNWQPANKRQPLFPSKCFIFKYLMENKWLAFALLNGWAWQVHNGRGHSDPEIV